MRQPLDLGLELKLINRAIPNICSIFISCHKVPAIISTNTGIDAMKMLSGHKQM